MKLLVFAHVPPPHHGQSYMVKLMLEGFGGDCRKHPEAGRSGHDIQCYHVNVRLSTHLEDIGDVRFGKIGLLIWYCLVAIWCRFRHGVRNFYYIPGPGKTSALVRDWLVMTICRPFFDRIILHWHAAGMASWLETSRRAVFRSLAYRTLGQPDLCIVLSKFNFRDAEKLWPCRLQVVSNGIPDPCPDFEQTVLPRRLARFSARQKLLAGETPTETELAEAGENPATYRILYLAHATRSKGLFDCIEGVRLAAARMRETQAPIRLQLTIAGGFLNEEEKSEFETLLKRPDLKDLVSYSGFVSGEQKTAAFRDADLFCFPTFYPNENQPVNLIEAIAWGVPVVTTRWRSVPELLPRDYDGLANPCSPDEVCQAILAVMKSRSGVRMRRVFEEGFRLDRHLSNLAEALKSVEREPVEHPAQAPQPLLLN